MVDGPEGLRPLDEESGGITRRQALKKGAILGGALAWATPVVQVIGMRPALAQTVSPACQFELIPVPGGPVIACLTFDQSVCDCVTGCGDCGDPPDPACEACAAACLDGAVPISVTPGPCP